MKPSLALAVSIPTLLFSSGFAISPPPEDNCVLDCGVQATNPAGTGSVPAGVSFAFDIAQGTERPGKALPVCATCKENYCKANINLIWDAHNTNYCLTLSTGPGAGTACTRSYFRTGIIWSNCGMTTTYTVTIRDGAGSPVYTESIICVCSCPHAG
jgi:hypothetical protein